MCFGLALWNKAIFLWALSGLVVGAVLVFWREIGKVWTLRNAGLAAVGFLLGALPFVIYNVRHPNVTLGSNAHIDTTALVPKLGFASQTLNGSILLDFLTPGEWADNPKTPTSLHGRASVWIRDHFGEHFVHQCGVGTARERRLLRLAHLRCRHHLHGFGDLRRILYRLDSPAYV